MKPYNKQLKFIKLDNYDDFFEKSKSLNDNSFPDKS